MIRSFALALALSVAPLGLASTAQAFTIGAEVGISSLAPCPSFCGGSGSSSGFTSDGGGGVASAADILDDVRGYGEGVAGFDAELLPTLGALANSEPNARVGTTATAYRAYTHSGPSTTMTLDVTLDGELSSAGVLDARARAVVSVILGTDLPHSTDVGTFRFEILPGTAGLEELGFVDISLDNNAGPQSKSDSISFDLDDGDTYFVWANLAVSGTRDGTADALDTLTMQFVPEPQAALLVGLGLVGLAVRRR